MKKLTKRNRKHNRKVVFGYHTECRPGEVSDYTTTTVGVWLWRTWTCTYSPDRCCGL